MSKQRFLGVEFGSTRIKAVVIDENHKTIESSDYQWQSKYENNVWTYDLVEAWSGFNDVLSKIKCLNEIQAMGISAMMHGYLAFDKDWNLLVPFRTWQNTITAEAADILTKEFGFNIPQRWSIAHLYQAILNKEDHLSKIAHITTLAGYVHYMLTGVNKIGIGEASGMFPIDGDINDYDKTMLEKFNKLVEKEKLPWKLIDLLPGVLLAGDSAGELNESGSKLLNKQLKVGIKFAPAEGDAGTGMTATNAVAERTGNVSAGTSIFSMVVLEHPLKEVHQEIDIVTTPTGKPVAMVHCNNCTNDSNAWFKVLKESAQLFGLDVNDGDLYTKLYEKSLEGDPDCGGVLVCNYLAGEGVTHLDSGRPLVVREINAKFTLANFLRAILYASMSTLKIGMDILAKEKVAIDSLTGHGGLFKTPVVGQKYLAAACNAPVTCMKTADVGGPYGMALLVAYMMNKNSQTLEQYLNEKVFKDVKGTTLKPIKEDVDGFNSYIEKFHNLLKVEEIAGKLL